MDIKNRIKELTDIINKASIEYYVNDNPSITDQEYDDYYRELLNLEEKYPEYKQKDSPTSKVGGQVVDKFEKVTFFPVFLSIFIIFK